MPRAALVLTLLGLLLVALLAPHASAQTLRQAAPTVDDAARSLTSDPVYVAPGAEDTLSQEEADALSRRIQASGQPIYIAIFPQGVGAAENVGEQLARTLRRRGTYGVAVGDSFVSNRPNLANAALDRGSDAPSTLNAFVDLAAESRGVSAPPAINTPSDRDGGGGGGGIRLLGLLGLGALGFGALSIVRGRRRKREEQAEIAELRDVASDDLGALGEDMRAVELDVELSKDPRAKERMAEAVAAYDRANTALTRARHPDDFQPIGNEIEHARWAIAAARAVAEGREEPARRPPCFFDPRHGPSVRDAMWSPDGGEPRPVPVCAADAQRLEIGELPQTREIVLGGQRMPYWRAPGQFAPFYAGGMFGGFGGFAPGLLFGTMLGAPLFADALTPDAAFGDVGDINPGDFGDFGGGDFGGGDFGGGDFGGFGGGDFGGGDF